MYFPWGKGMTMETLDNQVQNDEFTIHSSGFGFSSMSLCLTFY